MTTMDDEDAPKEFPDVSQKLAAPKKLSAFEKERLAAEEKRRREQAETAAALAEFEDSFGGNEDFDGFPPSARGPPAGPSRGRGSAYGGSRGGFGGPPRSGPGSLGAAAGPPPSIKRKRALDELREQQEIRREQAALAAEYNLGEDARHEELIRQIDEEPEVAAPRPTVQLSNMDPCVTEIEIRVLLKNHLKVHSVSISPPLFVGRLSVTAIATLDYETTTAQIDAAVSALRDKYLGSGYRLAISRHLSSTALQPGALQGTVYEPEPFGAERISRDHHRGYNMRNAPPPSDFAPPESRAFRNERSDAYAHVTVQLPSDIRTVRAIHILVERLLSEPDPVQALRIESCLMGDRLIESDERFAFLYDAASPEGLYYRYLLWNRENTFETLQEQRRTGVAPTRLFDDVAIDWIVVPGEVPFADLTRLGHLHGHPNYDESSDDESDDDAEKRKFNSGRREGEGGPVGGSKHLTPYQMFKFAWTLARMPKTQAKLRMGDVGLISDFAIRKAGVGAEQIVDMLVLNVEKPFCFTTCATDHAEVYRQLAEQDEEDMYEPDEELPSIGTHTNGLGSKDRRDADVDLSQVKLVALYLINDILLNSATAGVRNAWKYRQLIENGLRRQNTFKKLGRLGKELGWGRMKEQQWRNKVGSLFEIWERNSVFATDAFETFKKDFFEHAANETTDHHDADRQASLADSKHLAKFKRIDGTASPVTAASASPAPMPPSDAAADGDVVDGAPVDDLDGMAIDDLDGAPMDDLDGTAIDDLDGTPMDDLDGGPIDDLDDVPAKEPTPPESKSATEIDTPLQQLPPTEAAKANGTSFSLKSSGNSKPAPVEMARKKQAEDMFADSDEE